MPIKHRNSFAPRLLLLIGASVAVLLGTGCEPAAPTGTETVEARTGPVRQVSLSIEGMHCEACVNAITESVTSIDGVKTITIRLEEGLATVDAVESVPETEITEAIEKLGYTAQTVPVGSDEAPEQPG